MMSDTEELKRELSKLHEERRQEDRTERANMIAWMKELNKEVKSLNEKMDMKMELVREVKQTADELSDDVFTLKDDITGKSGLLARVQAVEEKIKTGLAVIGLITSAGLVALGAWLTGIFDSRKP